MTTELAFSPTPLLEIQLTQTDGTIARFAQDDPALVRQILDSLTPSKLFTVPHFVLGGDGALSAFATARIERVDLIAAQLPSWPYLGGATAVRELTEERFRAAYDPDQATANRQEAGDKPGITQVGYTELWTASGHRVFWEVEVESRLMMRADFGPYLQSLFGAGGLHAQREGVGVSILNPSALTRVVFHPGPPVLPFKAWPARRL
ncbi:hypothetical protein CCAX7_35840 [Capsulimonas corticalis]|uniref:Uncharacterized protein n=1 Tax=Capsulimonas corticalis TaxID=2219043 RepID=A0A402D650_9BACT|nr:hypothetical protein [Capsulimonas corticalis]BDI31533.1 hypothetical protein CCAX7_35840 [Capsulimonas corticalis]